MDKFTFLFLTCIALYCPSASAQDCVYVDFQYTIGANGEVSFKCLDEEKTFVSWQWHFGDGAIGTDSTAVHRYTITNSKDSTVCFDVWLQANNGTNTGFSQHQKICIPTNTQMGENSFLVNIISPTERYDGATNTNIAKIIANEQANFEATVLGGTPPYRYVWTLPKSAQPLSILVGKGPHKVVFPNSSRDSTLRDSAVLVVTDALGIESMSKVYISIRNSIDGPGKIMIIPSQLPICADEEVVFKAKPNNPFGLDYRYYSGLYFDPYKWIIDGRELISNRFVQNPFTFKEGNHEIKLEIKNNSSTYFAEPLHITVQSKAVCAEKKSSDIIKRKKYAPLSVSEFESTWDCNSGAFLFDVTHKINGGLPIELDTNGQLISLDSADFYKNIIWKAYYFGNPNREITDFVTVVENSGNKKAKVKFSHPYFNAFPNGERPIFVIDATVADADGNIANYAQVVGFDSPLQIILADSITRCKTSQTPLNDIPFVVGGKMPYSYKWTSADTSIFAFTPTSTTENPTLNLDKALTSHKINLTVTDNAGCVAHKDILIEPIEKLSPISLGNVPIMACSNRSSTTIIGPINKTPKNLASSLRGSGDYSYRWTCSDYDGLDSLNDPTIPYPIVYASKDANGLRYKLKITDNQGQCFTESNEITVKGVTKDFTVDLGSADSVLCPSIKNIVKLKAKTIDHDGKPMTSGIVYQWESNNINFSTNTTTSELVVPNLPNNSQYTYTVTAIERETGCSTQDTIRVEIKKGWVYRGFESVTAPLLLGQKGALWASSDNEIFANDVFGSGAILPFSNKPLPKSILSGIRYNVNGAIKQGKFAGNNTIITVMDSSGCQNDFPSNTYYVLSENPSLFVHADKNVIGGADELCLNLTLNTHIVTGHKYLPASFNVPYKLQQIILSNNHIVYHLGNGYVGNIEFELTDAVLGIYTAVTCIRMPNIEEQSDFVFLIKSALPNSTVTGVGTFKAEHPFQVMPTQTRKLDNTQATQALAQSNNFKERKDLFHVYPNPFSDDITLNYIVKAENGSTINLRVYDSMGKLIDKISENHFHPLGVFSIVYDTGKLVSGLYFFELTLDGEKIIQKSMKVDR